MSNFRVTNELPFISVIITAFTRRQFLPYALESVAFQTLDRSRYEIIVVKNFTDRGIDSKIKEIGGKEIIKGNEDIGMFLANAVEQSSGQILVFLDDDDEFSETKLESIYNVFRAYPKAGYFRNDRVLIDIKGKPLKTRFRHEESDYIQQLGSFLVEPPISLKEGNRLFWISAFAYMSCIAVKKNVILPRLEYLRKIKTAQDFFMFYCALISQVTMVIDSEKLTKYRLHGENVSIINAQNPSILRKYIKVRAQAIRTLEILQEIAKQEQAPQSVKKMIRHDIWMRKVSMDLLDSNSAKDVVLNDLVRSLRYTFRATVLYQAKLAIRSFVYLINRRVATQYLLSS